jgi:hypothetical protein
VLISLNPTWYGPGFKLPHCGKELAGASDPSIRIDIQIDKNIFEDLLSYRLLMPFSTYAGKGTCRHYLSCAVTAACDSRQLRPGQGD